ncbi:trans-aconitate 2-methyltransferase [Mucilaginibacter terrae]|uniref:trans-aconitate 2-methyltransferase n=1 Tax=Mucilaginibacter terrae TaxID=1955052 RepID=UPI003640D624
MRWSSVQYSKFENERNRPIHDLLAQIPNSNVKTAADIGCGPGNSTELLVQKYPGAHIIGMDSSANMIEAARKRIPAVVFEVADIATWPNPGAFDVILANASLQWVPDHASLFPALIAKLAPGGTLAVQMPDNFNEPAHRLMREVAANGTWSNKLANSSKRLVRESADWYYEHLRGKVASVNIWRTTYYHTLTGGSGAVVEWFKGTGLQPFLAPLNEEERSLFSDQYQHEISKAYPAYANGTVLLPFPRLFIVATR